MLIVNWLSIDYQIAATLPNDENETDETLIYWSSWLEWELNIIKFDCNQVKWNEMRLELELMREWIVIAGGELIARLLRDGQYERRETKRFIERRRQRLFR